MPRCPARRRGARRVVNARGKRRERCRCGSDGRGAGDARITGILAECTRSGVALVCSEFCLDTAVLAIAPGRIHPPRAPRCHPRTSNTPAILALVTRVFFGCSFLRHVQLRYNYESRHSPQLFREIPGPWPSFTRIACFCNHSGHRHIQLRDDYESTHRLQPCRETSGGKGGTNARIS